jgi:hypothetical protein
MAMLFVPDPRPLPALDEDGFPPFGDDTLGTLFVSDESVINHCELITGLRMLGWVAVGRLA